MKKHKTIKLKWNGIEYNSIQDFEDEHDLSIGYIRSYIKKEKLFRGHKVVKL